MHKLSHINQDGEARMVDVSGKKTSQRRAVARGEIHMQKEVLQAIIDQTIPKGDVLSVGRIAGIMAAKKTSELIPMCHLLLLDSTTLDLQIDEKKSCVQATARVSATGVTGVEMEALTAVSMALLAIYDMIKAVDKSMVIKNVRLLEKHGGKSGTYLRSEDVGHD